MSRILWIANAPWAPSGYGEQTALFLPRLRALGHDIAIAANFGLHGTMSNWEGFKVYPADGHWGATTLSTYAEDHQADLVIILHDAWPLRPELWGEGGPPVAVWAPVDHYPLPPMVQTILTHPRVRPIAMSRFGEQQMRDAKLEPLYVPHAVDTALFCPRPSLRDTVRDELEIPREAFLVGMVGANKGSAEKCRKSFDKAFAAFAHFAERHEDAFMYVHTEAQPRSGGLDLDRLANMVNVPEARLKFPPESAWHLGMPRELMAKIYQAFDVLLSPSKGEGFGIPILEAQASGIPVICSDHSAMSELTEVGWLVAGDPDWDELQASFFYVPFIDAIDAALEASYEHRGEVPMRAAAANFAQAYDVDAVVKTYWQPALEELLGARRVGPLPAAKPNREQRRALQKAKR